MPLHRFAVRHARTTNPLTLRPARPHLERQYQPSLHRQLFTRPAWLKAENQPHWLRTTLWYTQLLTGGFLLGHLFFGYFYNYGMTWGVSMIPTLPADLRLVIISKYYRRGRDLKVGDVISFTHPLASDTSAIKRIVGMPGDFVLRDRPLEIEELGKTEPRPILEQGAGIPMMVQVPAGHCYVVGDNYKHSRDSRHFGPLPLNLVLGKIVAFYERKGPMPWFKAVENNLKDFDPDEAGL